MSPDPKAAAMQWYHDRFDAAQYNAISEFLASNLNADQGDSRVVDLPCSSAARKCLCRTLGMLSTGSMSRPAAHSE